jgi:hypothetical protein
MHCILEHDGNHLNLNGQILHATRKEEIYQESSDLLAMRGKAIWNCLKLTAGWAGPQAALYWKITTRSKNMII